MREFTVFKIILTIWVLFGVLLFFVGCGGGPTAPSTVTTHTADIDPPLLNPNREDEVVRESPNPGGSIFTPPPPIEWPIPHPNGPKHKPNPGRGHRR